MYNLLTSLSSYPSRTSRVALTLTCFTSALTHSISSQSTLCRTSFRSTTLQSACIYRTFHLNRRRYHRMASSLVVCLSSTLTLYLFILSHGPAGKPCACTYLCLSLYRSIHCICPPVPHLTWLSATDQRNKSNCKGAIGLHRDDHCLAHHWCRVAHNSAVPVPNSTLLTTTTVIIIVVTVVVVALSLVKGSKLVPVASSFAISFQTGYHSIPFKCKARIETPFRLLSIFLDQYLIKHFAKPSDKECHALTMRYQLVSLQNKPTRMQEHTLHL